jgi:hypothetical protein
MSPATHGTESIHIISLASKSMACTHYTWTHAAGRPAGGAADDERSNRHAPNNSVATAGRVPAASASCCCRRVAEQGYRALARACCVRPPGSFRGMATHPGKKHALAAAGGACTHTPTHPSCVLRMARAGAARGQSTQLATKPKVVCEVTRYPRIFLLSYPKPACMRSL